MTDGFISWPWTLEIEMSQVEGRNPVKASLQGGNVRRIIVNRGTRNSNKMQEIIRLASRKKVNVEYVSKDRLDRESKTGRHQGVIGFLAKSEYATLDSVLSKDKMNLCFVLLDKVQDPQNLGSILRTGAATDVDAVVVPRKSSVGLTPAVRRTAMGGDTVVPVIQGSLHRVVRSLKEEGFTIIGVDGSASKEIYSERLTGAVAFILGGEHHGLADQILEKCDSVVRIPMSGGAQSLNVGVAAAVVLYERVRQQGKV